MATRGCGNIGGRGLTLAGPSLNLLGDGLRDTPNLRLRVQ